MQYVITENKTSGFRTLMCNKPLAHEIEHSDCFLAALRRIPKTSAAVVMFGAGWPRMSSPQRSCSTVFYIISASEPFHDCSKLCQSGDSSNPEQSAMRCRGAAISHHMAQYCTPRQQSSGFGCINASQRVAMEECATDFTMRHLAKHHRGDCCYCSKAKICLPPYSLKRMPVKMQTLFGLLTWCHSAATSAPEAIKSDTSPLEPQLAQYHRAVRPCAHTWYSVCLHRAGV